MSSQPATLSAPAFRAALERLGLSQSAFARELRALGATSSFETVLRRVSHYCSGTHPISDDMRIIVTLLEQRRGAPAAPRRRTGRPQPARPAAR